MNRELPREQTEYLRIITNRIRSLIAELFKLFSSEGRIDLAVVTHEFQRMDMKVLDLITGINHMNPYQPFVFFRQAPLPRQSDLAAIAESTEDEDSMPIGFEGSYEEVSDETPDDSFGRLIIPH
ncbi:CLUMA_CG017518, isoform A [Clunio marinus]|uniref:CLUMA_CG017518, isoform A n=1 Tax=Clunio marinus TaxID=568069 RepID=A0A1J1J0Q9_9DIPT|nr:CLUMA_CG017518, isoform A [Clunio marinus]